MLKLKYVDQRHINKLIKESEQIGKKTFHFAWVLDDNTQERERGVTFDIAYKKIETNKFNINLMDAPGHRDFVPNMITGASQADCALLIIDSSPSAFESGFSGGGQTKEHAILAYAIGVKQMIVIVNKMEVSDWNEKRFNEIDQILTPFLINIGFKKENIRYVAVSGLLGKNLIKEEINNNNNSTWYTKKGSLVDMIDTFDIPKKKFNYPYRLVVTDTGKGISSASNKQGSYITCILEAGEFNNNVNTTIYPLNQNIHINEIVKNNEITDEVYPGEVVNLFVNINDELFNSIK